MARARRNEGRRGGAIQAAIGQAEVVQARRQRVLVQLLGRGLPYQFVGQIDDPGKRLGCLGNSPLRDWAAPRLL